MKTSVTFSNLAFCNPLAYTYINVYQNVAYGNKDGTRDAYVDTTATGDCSGLLSYFWQWG